MPCDSCMLYTQMLEKACGGSFCHGIKYGLGMLFGAILTAARLETYRKRAPLLETVSNCAPISVRMSVLSAVYLIPPFFSMGVGEIFTQPVLMHLAYTRSPASMRTLGILGFCQRVVPGEVKALRAAVEETGSSKPFSAYITADDLAEMFARSMHVMSRIGPWAEDCALLVDGYVAAGAAIAVARRSLPQQLGHYCRAGYGAVTNPPTQHGYPAFVLSKISLTVGAGDVHVGTLSVGMVEGVRWTRTSSSCCREVRQTARTSTGLGRG